jgi:hypothetical protein
MTKTASPHAVTFALITVLLDTVGSVLIMPVLPALIRDMGQMSVADAVTQAPDMVVSVTAGVLVPFATVKPREADV